MRLSRVFIVLALLAGLIAFLAPYAGRQPQEHEPVAQEGQTGGIESSASQNVPAGEEDSLAAAMEIWQKNLALMRAGEVKPKGLSKADILARSQEFFDKSAAIMAELAARASNGQDRGNTFVCTDAVFMGTVSRGETLSKVLEKTVEGKVEHYIKAASKVFSFRAFREGQPYVVVRDAVSGKVKRFEYEINDNRRLVVEGLEQPRAKLEDIEYNHKLEKASGVISDNLFQAVADCGETPQLAFRLVNLFGSEINFIRDLQEGDSFTVLVEKRFREGDYKGYGRIIAAQFTNRGKIYEAFLFHDSVGKPAYYNRKGENLHKTLLQSPLAVTRVTSRFSHNRKHPVLGYSRPHLGVDYGAPTGTPVKAVGEGVVTKKGWGGGYGNQIILKHSEGLESLYAHLSGFARGLREGQKVSQGQVIGFVGSTGLSTGPHLDFRLRQYGKFVDPTKAINPRSLPVSKKLIGEFEKTRDLQLSCLEGDKTFENYTVDSIVPLPVKLHEDKATGKRFKKEVQKDAAPRRAARKHKRSAKRR